MGAARIDGPGDAFGISPHYDWKAFETAHFRITFPKPLAETAQRSANYMEQAYGILTQKLNWIPDSKIHVLVIDNSDAANGLASAFQRFGIILQVTPPEPWFSTSYYDDWLKLLCFHELTHIINMDATTDLFAVLRVIFGDVFLPNAVLPSWMLEGLAVYMETRLTSAGRGRSPYWEAILRSAVEAGKLGDSSWVPLDRLGGSSPYFPGGENAYLFGYQLMNRVAQKSGDDALGEMSSRGGARIPFLINGNIENITGQDWYGFWDSWIRDSRARFTRDLEKIKAAGATSSEKLTQSGATTLGAAVSPDGAWIAYTEDSIHQRMGLYLRELKSGKVRHITDKSLGVGKAWTPDSRYLIYSAMKRQSVYHSWSDLWVYDRTKGTRYAISDALRAKDPDISRDGKRVTFTLTRGETVGLAIADLTTGIGRVSLSNIKTIYTPDKWDRVSNPKFSPDGNRIVYSIHRNGAGQEDIGEVSLDGNSRTLVKNGAFNRYPAFHPSGDLYFTSDLSGVDNLYRYSGGKPEMRTNVTTALWLPTFSPKGELYASILSHNGWDLARVPMSARALSPESVRVSAPPAPKAETQGTDPKNTPNLSYPVQDYSPWSSLWPRQWAPFAYFDSTGAVLGGQVFGFDSLDRHRYAFGLTIDTAIKQPNYIVYYANRTLGPTFTLLATQQNDLLVSNSVYDREQDLSAAMSYPIAWTYSRVVPSLSYKLEKDTRVFRSTGGDTEYPFTEYSVTGLLSYSSTESSRLAIIPEGGRSSSLGARMYLRSKRESYKFLATHAEYLEILPHTVLKPSAKGSYSTTRIYGANVRNTRLQGRTGGVFDAISPDYLDELPVRGYPKVRVDTQSAVTAAADLSFPIAHVFRGWGTNPFFLNQISGTLFGETTYLPEYSPTNGMMNAVGGGIKLSTTTLVYVPLVATAEYHHGLNDNYRGKGEVVFKLALSGLGF